MAEAVIIKFKGVSQSQYEAASRHMGIDTQSAKSDWPQGLLMHAAGTADDGSFVVNEVWASRHAQEDFLHKRLRAALVANGITGEPSITWIPLIAFQTLGS